MSSPSSSGRSLDNSSCSPSSAMRCSRPSYARDSRCALAWLRVVQSALVSTCSRVSNGPASRTYRRTAESVHSPSPYPWNRRCSSTSRDTSRITSFGKRSAVSLFLVSFAPTTSCRWNATRPSGSSSRVFGLPMSCSSAASRTVRSPSRP